VGCLRAEREERGDTHHTHKANKSHTPLKHTTHTQHTDNAHPVSREALARAALHPPSHPPSNPHTHCVLMSVVWVVCVGVGVVCGCLCVCVVARGLFVGCSWQPEDKKAGSSESDTYVLNNHLRFKIKYHPVDTDGVMTEGNPDGYPFFLFSPYFSLQDQVPPCRH
jgi:hypothetical protein